jgi:hypothetical protein
MLFIERFARRPNQKCLILLYLCISFVWFVCALYFAYHLRTDRYETVTGHIIGAVNDHSVKLWWRRPDHETIVSRSGLTLEIAQKILYECI